MYMLSPQVQRLAVRWLKPLLVLVLAATAATAAVAAPSDAESQAVGTWYGEFAETGAPAQRFLTTRLPDGTYILRARLYDKSPPTELVNRGLWGISNGLYFTITTEINGQAVDARNAQAANHYLVQSQSATELVYRHLPSNRSFRVVRVDPATARLPD